MTSSTSDKLSTSIAIRALLKLHNQDSKPSFTKTLGIFRPLLTILEVSFKKTYSIS